jgi:hypothetical protein
MRAPGRRAVSSRHAAKAGSRAALDRRRSSHVDTGHHLRDREITPREVEEAG